MAASDTNRFRLQRWTAEFAEPAAEHALVKATIEAHGGALEIESKVGAGSTFTLRFPAARTGFAAAA